LKNAVIREAKAKGMDPVHFLEELIREKINPYGYTDVKDSVKYVRNCVKNQKIRLMKISLRKSSSGENKSSDRYRYLY